MNTIIFDRNMLAITSVQGPTCADKIRNSIPNPKIKIDLSKTNLQVPYYEKENRKIYFHSRMNPQNEANQFAKEYSKHGFYIFLGLGAAYQIAALLDNNTISRSIILEYDPTIIRSIIENIDITHVLGDKRTRLLVDPEDEELAEAIEAYYVPSITGDFTSVPLRNRIEIDHEKYQNAIKIIHHSIDSISDDYSVQSFFGKRWFLNTIKNISLSENPTPPIGFIENAIITAAGPSLEASFETIRNRQKNQFLIATDTSLRALLEQDIKPDAVISIDCQHISYYHFSLGIPKDIPLFLDLSSPPTIARLTNNLYFFSSGHPLERYMTSHFRAFPALDTSGGNVTHAAVSLAYYLGAKNITIYGADFSYPFGKCYSRGTYVYPYFDLRQSRLKPFDSLFSEFLYRNQFLDREIESDGTFRYISKPLIAYKERLEKFAENIPCNITRVQGLGVATKNMHKKYSNNSGKMYSAGKVFQSPKDFLISYAKEIEALPDFDGAPALYMDSLLPKEQDILMTMIPTVATFKRECNNPNATALEIIKETRAWCIKVINDELKAE